MAYDLICGYTGIVSLGHSVLYGMGAYSVGILSVMILKVTNPLILILSAIALGAFLGLILGFLCSFSRGVYALLVSFAFAQIFWLFVMADPLHITNGESGITGLRPPPLNLGGFTLDLFRGNGLYYLVLIVFLISYTLIRMITNSQFGFILKGIKENEDRLRSLGYDTRQYKMLAFTLSGIFSAIAGVLTAFLENAISPGIVHWITGAQILLMEILGGQGTLIGPVIGSFLVTFLKFWSGENWVYYLASLYILVVMFLPRGLWGVLQDLLAKLRK